MGHYLCDLGRGDFLNKTQKVLPITGKTDTFHYINIKNFCSWKNEIKWQWGAPNWEMKPGTHKQRIGTKKKWIQINKETDNK